MTEHGDASALEELSTEQVRSELADLDLLSSEQLVALMCSDVHRVPDAVTAAQSQIARCVDEVVVRMRRGGRLIYLGAGTAGRVGMLDAAEARPTFNIEPGRVIGVLAGGMGAWSLPVENAEDDSEQGAAEIAKLQVSALDVVIGVAASGRTPYVLGAIDAANRAGACTVALVCNPASPAAAATQIAIEVLVGPEVIAGSTRLNAGTAQKVVLNIISTTAMVRLGKTYGSLMVDLRATNEKLRDRAIRIVCDITGAPADEARTALERASWRPKVAAVMLLGGVDEARAERELVLRGGRLRPTLATISARSASAVAVPGASRRLGVAGAFIDGRLIEGDIAIRDGEIEAFGLTGAGEGVAIPGLVDAQLNGYAGVDVLSADAEQLIEMGAALLRDGVTAYLPTLVTAPESDLLSALHTVAELPELPGRTAAIIGVHLEGPFLSPQRAGAHPREHLRAPDVAMLERLLDAGPVRMVTLAPELPGALELIAMCVARGVVVSLGHSQARAEHVSAALAAGASGVTHLFNAMGPASGRDPGLPGTALVSPRCAIQLVADGVHLADESIRLAFAAALGRCSIVSDAIAAATLEDGSYRLGVVPVEVRHGVARRADGTLAGAVSPLAHGLATLRRIGIAEDDAIAAATRRPAALVREARHGRLVLGARSDIVVLDSAHHIQRMIVAGRELEPTTHC